MPSPQTYFVEGGQNLKVVYPICCGVDVHKTFLVANVITTEEITPHYQKKRFPTFNNRILEFKQWLLEKNSYYINVRQRSIHIQRNGNATVHLAVWM